MNPATRIRTFVNRVNGRFFRTGVNHGRSRSTAGSTGSGTGHAALSVSAAGPIPVPSIHLPALPNTARNADPSPSLIAAWRQARHHGNLKYEELSLPVLLRSADKNLRLPASKLGEEIVAYRVWRVFWESGDCEQAAQPRLGSAHYGKIPWEPGVPMTADIDATRPQRRTGIHAYSDKPNMIVSSVAPCLQSAEYIVAGTVSLWGTVIVYEHGYRAQFAYPRQLCWTNGDPALLQELAAIYGCEVFAPHVRETDAA
jgi:hypothetical protein